MKRRSESGQATTEYLLLLIIVVGLITSLGRQIVKPALQQLAGSLETMITRQFSRGLHQYRNR